MKEIKIIIPNPENPNEMRKFEDEYGLMNFLVEIDGRVLHNIQRFAIDLSDKDFEQSNCYPWDIPCTIEKKLNVTEMFYNDTDKMRDWEEIEKMRRDKIFDKN